MAKVIIGSARSDEKGKITGGKPGDQKQTSKPDRKGEVSLQDFYLHNKGWLVLSPKSPEHAKKIAANMLTACNNPHLGYNQADRYGVIKHGVATQTDANCDCSALVRACVKEATGKDPGEFNTANEASVLESSGLFSKRQVYKSGMTLYTGDVLVTRRKGHTVIVVEGAERTEPPKCFPKYKGISISIVKALEAVGADSSLAYRKKIAQKNGIKDYAGTAEQNIALLKKLKNGTLLVP